MGGGGVSGAGGGRGDYIAFNVFVSWRERSRKEAVVFCLFHEFFHGEKKVLNFFLFSLLKSQVPMFSL